jgi:hypothetical protein
MAAMTGGIAMRFLKSMSACILLTLATNSFAQSMSFADVLATGAKPLDAAAVRELVSGAKTEFTLVNGSVRLWTNSPDGTFIPSRTNGEANRRSGRGTWSVNDDAALCLTFDWGSMETEAFCRRLYPVEDRFYAFPLTAKPTTLSGRYRFAK